VSPISALRSQLTIHPTTSIANAFTRLCNSDVTDDDAALLPLRHPQTNKLIPGQPADIQSARAMTGSYKLLPGCFIISDIFTPIYRARVENHNASVGCTSPRTFLCCTRPRAAASSQGAPSGTRHFGRHVEISAVGDGGVKDKVRHLTFAMILMYHFQSLFHLYLWSGSIRYLATS
jgi:hypothetical protein